jgi:hypothetical protein
VGETAAGATGEGGAETGAAAAFLAFPFFPLGSGAGAESSFSFLSLPFFPDIYTTVTF